jgi:hypothetical protein
MRREQRYTDPGPHHSDGEGAIETLCSAGSGSARLDFDSDVDMNKLFYKI